MKVAAAQISCALGDPKANLLKVRDFSQRAKDGGVDLIVFPEMTDTGYSMPVIQEHANSWTSGFVPGLQEIAAKLSIAIDNTVRGAITFRRELGSSREPIVEKP